MSGLLFANFVGGGQMGLFNLSQIEKINKVAEKSKVALQPPKPTKAKTINHDLNEISKTVLEYFKDSEAICITTKEDLHSYVDALIESGYAGIDTETTGLDRYKDYVVGASLYYPGGVECYIPMKHIIPIFDEPYKNQLTYEQVSEEFKRIAESDVKLIFANADFDLSMIYKDLKVDFCDRCYYDVILAWRCLKENELHNGLKELYHKYVMKGEGDAKKFSDFFSPALFPYCKPEVAKLYAANDAKITYDLFRWQLPYCTKDHPKCKKAGLEAISDLIWNVEFPLIRECQAMHRTGIYIDKDVATKLKSRYADKYNKELALLQDMVQEIVDNSAYTSSAKKPFRQGKEFNPQSPIHVKYLIYTLMNIPSGKDGGGTGKEILGQFNLPVTNQILKVRSLSTLISTFVDKLPAATTPDGRIHAQFKQIGADTGRMSSADPNMQNIPSHSTDIRHMFRATPGYVMLSSDYSSQEPRITAYVSNDPKMIQTFKDGRDIYGSIASIAFNVPYESCLEFNPDTGEYQPDGKARRGEAKTIVLGICYGRSVITIADQLYGKDDTLNQDEKIKKAQKVYDSVLNAFPNLRSLMIGAQASATKQGYVTTILGRRRHIPDMQLPEFEFKPLPGYVNPDIDPLDIATLDNRATIPDRVVAQLMKEFKGYKYFGQIAKRTKELYEEHIRVINNRPKITDASRKCVNSIIQGSAADQTKLAILMLESNEEWKELGGRLLIPVHDELLAEVPIENWKRGGEILSQMMCEAANFLPFPSKCDVTTTFRWYGLEYPCPYPEPQSFDNMTEDEVKWVQYHLCEEEYILPIYPDENGDKPRGDAASGVNGVVSDEYKEDIKHYMNRYNLGTEDFIPHIKAKVQMGAVS